jgi:hypothetical protein
MGVGVLTDMTLSDDQFTGVLWKATPASLAVTLSGGRYKAWPYIQLLSRKLVDVAVGRTKRLIVTMPPRHGKSEMISHYFPVWLTENFKKRIILCSYEAGFAADWGGKVRDTIINNSDKFNQKQPAMHAWRAATGGEMTTAGVGGPITGKGADVLIVDDYCKNSEEAESLTIRDKTWNWWTSTARTRLEPGGSIVILATRWHSDDLIGRLVDDSFCSEKGMREKWEVFVFPALAEFESEKYYEKFGVVVNNLSHGSLTPTKKEEKSIAQLISESRDIESVWVDALGRKKGQALCPDRFDERDLAMLRGSVSEKVWHSLYQQRPGDEVDDGNVYHSFSLEKNCRPISYSNRANLAVSMDFNVNPMSAIIAQYTQGSTLDRVDVLEEIILPDSNTDEMCKRLIIELEKYRQGRHVLRVEIYGDAAGTQRSPNSALTNWAIVASFFSLHPEFNVCFHRRTRNPLVKDRVNAVNTMLCSADGTRRLFINDVKCPELITDFKKVKWHSDSDGNTTAQIDKRDPKRTHISDALGYMIEYRFNLKQKGGARRGIMM